MLLITAWILAMGPRFGFSEFQSQTVDVTELESLEERWNQAHLQGNKEALDKLWADDLVVIVPGMPPMTKSETLRAWESGEIKFILYRSSDLHFKVYDDCAVVTGSLERTREFGGQSRNDNWRFTKVYVRIEGSWRVVAFHASQLP